MSHLIDIQIDDADRPKPTMEMEQERRVAIFDLLEDNSFSLPGRGEQAAPEGPFKLNIAIKERRLIFDVRNEAGNEEAEFHLSLGPFRQVVKDYFQICESYFEAVKASTPGQIETIDMARRGIHNEGAEVLQTRLEGKAELDSATARRLFTLICVLHWGA